MMYIMYIKNISHYNPIAGVDYKLMTYHTICKRLLSKNNSCHTTKASLLARKYAVGMISVDSFLVSIGSSNTFLGIVCKLML